MNNDLYFIPIIGEALQQSDPEKSLRKALDQIKSIGEQSRYQVGFKQFERFMALIEDRLNAGQSEFGDFVTVSRLITELVTDIFEGGEAEKQKTLSLIRSQPLWCREYDKLIAETEWLNRRPTGIGITIFRENRKFDSVIYEEIPESKAVEDITSGRYRIAFATGRLIWEGEFTEQDLLWIRAFPGRPLELAADTSGWKGNPTKYISALKGEITIRVFAGLESGRIEIALNAPGDVK